MLRKRNALRTVGNVTKCPESVAHAGSVHDKNSRSHANFVKPSVESRSEAHGRDGSEHGKCVPHTTPGIKTHVTIACLLWFFWLLWGALCSREDATKSFVCATQAKTIHEVFFKNKCVANVHTASKLSATQFKPPHVPTLRPTLPPHP